MRSLEKKPIFSSCGDMTDATNLMFNTKIKPNEIYNLHTKSCCKF